MSNTASRQKILDTAADLFYREGFRATGVDTLAAASGTGKMTLYRHFATKDELIAAYLEYSNQQFWNWFESTTAGANTPQEKIIAFFTSLENLVNQSTCHGCPFLNAAVDFPDNDHPGHRLAVEHKTAVRLRFRQLAVQAGISDPDLLADHLLLLMDGAFMAVRMYGTENPAAHVASAAQALLNAASGA